MDRRRRLLRSRSLPLLSLFAGGLTYFLIPIGTFGEQDVVARAILFGVAAGVTALAALRLTDRPKQT